MSAGILREVVDFQRDTKPESTPGAAWISQVQLSAGDQDSDVDAANHPLREITAGSPLRYGTFTFYQAGCRQLPHELSLSELRVTSDPGRIWKYLGGAIMGGGILFLLCLRILARRAIRRAPQP